MTAMGFLISFRHPLLPYRHIFCSYAGFCADRQCSAPRIRAAGLRFSYLTQHSPQTVDRGFKACKTNVQKGVRYQTRWTSKPDIDEVGGVS